VVEHPHVTVGTPAEYAYWESQLRKFVTAQGGDPANIERVDARLNYKGNRITLYRLADPSDERSVADTLSHEFLHSLLYQMDELLAARLIDLVGKPVGNPGRIGGI
jgi:hypothetical protein